MTRQLHPSDARDALVDALVDLLHVHDGDDDNVEAELAAARSTADLHYAAERGTPDAPTIEKEDTPA